MNEQFKMVVSDCFNHSKGTLAVRVLILVCCCEYDLDGGGGGQVVVLRVSCSACSIVPQPTTLPRAPDLI
jgi:hypothetical protein